MVGWLSSLIGQRRRDSRGLNALERGSLLAFINRQIATISRPR
jgi:hypothetical protein